MAKPKLPPDLSPLIDDETFDRLCKLFNYTPRGIPLTNEEAAEILRCSPSALDYRRQKGTKPNAPTDANDGPRYFNPNGSRRVLYAERDVFAYLALGLCHSTAEGSAKKLAAA